MVTVQDFVEGETQKLVELHYISPLSTLGGKELLIKRSS